MTAALSHDHNHATGHATDQRILALFDQNMSIPRIAMRLGIGVDAVRHTITLERGPKPSTQRRHDRKKRAWAYYDEGMSIAEIASRCQVNSRTIHRWLNEYRTPAQNTPVSPEQHRRIQQMLEEQTPFIEIADTLGLRWSQIAHHYRGQGWTSHQTASFYAWLQRHPDAKSLLRWHGAHRIDRGLTERTSRS